MIRLGQIPGCRYLPLHHVQCIRSKNIREKENGNLNEEVGHNTLRNPFSLTWRNRKRSRQHPVASQISFRFSILGLNNDVLTQGPVHACRLEEL